MFTPAALTAHSEHAALFTLATSDTPAPAAPDNQIVRRILGRLARSILQIRAASFRAI
ncbi:MAG: hypothetical protein AAFY35_13915 [Pseudomonadota bacterium]